jgi:hypothetical protein
MVTEKGSDFVKSVFAIFLAWVWLVLVVLAKQYINKKIEGKT